MNCKNCGHENPEKALTCYWCGLDPVTGETPYPALGAPAVSFWDALVVPEITLPPPIKVAQLLGPDNTLSSEQLYLAIPEPPAIEIAPPPAVPDQDQFKIRRRRARRRPVVRVPTTTPPVMHPFLPALGRLLVFFGGLLLLFILGLVLVAAVGTASFGVAFCLVGLLGLGGVLWVALLAARAGRRLVEETGEVYERLEVLGRVLREVAPGIVQELPLNLPAKLGVLDQPVAYSELRTLAAPDGEAPIGLAENLLTGAITSLVGRDDVTLARRIYPVDVRGTLTRPTTTEVSRPVLTRRRAYAGPGVLEEQVSRSLRTDQSITVEELLKALLQPGGRQRAQQVVDAVNEALSEHPPDLDLLASPEDALAEFERYRDAVRRADPELYQLLEAEVRRGLAAAMRRPIPSSLMDLARSAADGVERMRPPQP